MKIVISVVLALFLLGCSEDSSQETQTQAATQSVKDVVMEPIVEETEEPMIDEAQEPMLEEGEEVMIEEPQEPMLEENEEAMIAEPQEEAEVVVVEDMVLVETTSLDGKTIYKACASCHGVNAEKSALGKSKIIKGWSESQIATALYGYKDSTYGGAMKGIMKGQVSKLSDEDIEVVSEYISTL